MGDKFQDAKPSAPPADQSAKFAKMAAYIVPGNTSTNEKIVLRETSHPNPERVFIEHGDARVEANRVCPQSSVCGSVCPDVNRCEILTTPCQASCETITVPVHRFLIEIEIITEQEVCPPTPRPLMGIIREIEYEVPVRNMQPSVVEICPPSVEITCTSQEYTSQETDIISKKEFVSTTRDGRTAFPELDTTVTSTVCDPEGCKTSVKETIEPECGATIATCPIVACASPAMCSVRPDIDTVTTSTICDPEGCKTSVKETIDAGGVAPTVCAKNPCRSRKCRRLNSITSVISSSESMPTSEIIHNKKGD